MDNNTNTIFHEDMSTNNGEKVMRNKRGDTRGMSAAAREALKKGYGNNADALEKNKWKPGQSGNPAGRPKGTGSRIKELLEGLLTVKQIKQNTNLDERDINAIEQIILSLDTPALQAIAKSDKTPVYMRTLAMSAMWDMKNGKTATMNLLRDRQFGAVKKQVDVTTNGEGLIPQSMTPDEAKDLLKRIEESC